MNAPSAGFAVAPLTPAIGGLVSGLALARPLSDAVVARLKAAVSERHVLFFEGQTLDPAAQRDFAHASASYTSIRSTRMLTAFPKSRQLRPAPTICPTTTTATATSPSSRRRLLAPSLRLASCRRVAETPCGARMSPPTRRFPRRFARCSTD
jgi:hypothetical protein